MNEITFRSLSGTERVKYVNECLEGNIRLKDIAKNIGIAYSSMTSLLNREGYIYSHAKKQYVLTTTKEIKETYKSETLMDFLKNNEDILRKVIDYHSSTTLIINPRVYEEDGNFVLKNFKVNESILGQFNVLMKNKYPQYRIQDAMSQALLDFLDKYS